MIEDADRGLPAAVFGADPDVGRDLAQVDWAATPLGTAVGLAAEPSDRGEHPAVVAIPDVDGVGSGADVLLQRRLPARHPRPQIPVGAGPAGQRGVVGDLGRHRSAHRPRAVDRNKRRGTRACCCSWSAPATPRRPITRSPTVRLRDDGGQVVGMLCVVSEDTHQVIGERRMATLRHLGSDPSVIRTEEERLTFAASPARPKPARPALHADLPLRRERRRAAGGNERHRRRPPGCPRGAAADGGAIWPVRRGRAGRVGAGRTGRCSVHGPADGGLARTTGEGAGGAADGAGRHVRVGSWWPR